MPDENTMTSADFEIIYNAVCRDPCADSDAFRKFLDDLGVDAFIEARLNQENTLMMTSDCGVAVHRAQDGVEFRGYAYLSAPGYLQIWMEAISMPELALLAVAHLSWDRNPETEEQHEQYATRLRAVLEA